MFPIVKYQDLQGIGMTNKLAPPMLIVLAPISPNKPTVGSMAGPYQNFYVREEAKTGKLEREIRSSPFG